MLQVEERESKRATVLDFEQSAPIRIEGFFNVQSRFNSILPDRVLAIKVTNTQKKQRLPRGPKQCHAYTQAAQIRTGW